MIISDMESRRKLGLSPSRCSSEKFQWKIANRNLQSYIECENLGAQRFYKLSSEGNSRKNNKQNFAMMKSIDYSDLEIERREKNRHIQTKRSEQSVFSKRKTVEGNRYRKQQENYMLNVETQVCEQDFGLSRRNLAEQNKCLKELIDLLEKQILDYGRKISSSQDLIYQISSQNQKLKLNRKEITYELNMLTERHKKEIEMNHHFEYVISELNQKIGHLIHQNRTLLQKIQLLQHKNHEQIVSEFSYQSDLSVNSATFNKDENTSESKDRDSIIEYLQSKILTELPQNWSFSALQISSFNKTPHKIYEVEPSSHENTPKSILETKQDENFEQIVLKHKKQINKLNERVKYFQIENSMLKRKKQLFQKNNEEINDLKHQIQKLTEQNKLIKLFKGKGHKSIFSFQRQKEDEQLQTCTNEIRQRMKERSPLNEKNFEKKSSERENRLREETNEGSDRQIGRRKSPIQRKFVRKQVKGIKSPSNVQQDSEVSFELSPERR